MLVLVTGSSGLIGSETVRHFDALGHRVVGVDNNQRRVFFGEEGDTTWNRQLLEASTSRFEPVFLDIRDRAGVFALFERSPFDLVVHCAAQPSHDLAARIPLDDFDINAVGTLNLLEATRRSCPDAVFIHMSTNKVYGDAPNELPMTELETRYDYLRPEDFGGISEDCRIDQSLHSLFGASKAAADLLAQEYGRYYGLNVGVFRGGCLTGPSHSGVQLHGFLNYLVKCAVNRQHYTVYGYKAKQVRDNIHSADVVTAFQAFAEDPRPGAVFNLGGGRENSISMLEAMALVEELSGRRVDYSYVDVARRGDHICYISDLRRLQAAYPKWTVTRSLRDMVLEMVESEIQRSEPC